MLVQVTVYWQLLASIHGYVLPHARTRRVDRVGRVGVHGPATSPLTLAVAVTSWTPDWTAWPPALLGFWTQRHLCTLTTLRADGRPHVVPVGVTVDVDQERTKVRIFCE